MLYVGEGVGRWDPNGKCYPCVMGWDLAGMGNYSAAVAVATVTIKCEVSVFEEKNPAGVLQKITF